MRNEKMNRGKAELQLKHAMTRGAEWLMDNGRTNQPYVLFVSTCMGRFYQMRIALLFNLCVSWGMRGCALFVVMTWREDEQELAQLARDAAFFIEAGFLRIASAGELGMRLACRWPEEWPSPPPENYTTAEPPPCDGGFQFQRTWHSPVTRMQLMFSRSRADNLQQVTART